MAKHIAALTFIYLCVCAAWMLLGSTVSVRTDQQNKSLNGEVQSLWGTEQRQIAPTVVEEVDITTDADKPHKRTKKIPSSLDGSDIRVNLALEQRKKGLLWYPTYKVGFAGTYKLSNNSDNNKTMEMRFDLPDQHGVYDNLKLQISNRKPEDLKPVG
ncbi:MAG: inner membrane CreD family protein, partial [Candidatus Obscuribacterales bacterium]|nr:inner membrane CreD family protein [Candidatus Obscuribacterales bacterium]